jgi:uncharacterized protein YdaU (DUF1376 family)
MPSKADIWMPLYIGDYLADTSHLDAERHGCYLLWIMHYWRKGPLPGHLADLVGIGKLRGSDASSIAQALLDEFFVKNGDGYWHQKRQDAERAKWQGKKDSAVEKAKKAAAGRWGDASSKPQAMLEPCPLPLPLPSTQIQNPSRAKTARATKTAIADERHTAFKEAVKRYWDSKNPGVDMPWGPAEGKQLGMWLREAPHITLEQFTVFLRNRYKSDVNHGERPCQWIKWITSYGPGPTDRFKNTAQENGNGRPNQNQQSPARERVNGNRRALAEIAVQRGWLVPPGAAQPDGEAIPESGFEGRPAGIHERPGAVEFEVLPPDR